MSANEFIIGGKKRKEKRKMKTNSRRREKKRWFGLRDFPHNRANPQAAICEWRWLSGRIRTAKSALWIITTSYYYSSSFSVHRTAALAVQPFACQPSPHSPPFRSLFSLPSFVFLLLPCGRNCFVRPPGLSGSQWSAIPGPSRRQPLALQRWNSPLVCQCPLLIAYAFTDGCWFFPDGKKISVEGNQP